MPAIFKYELTVPDEAIDGQGHVNNLEHLRWMQEAAVAHSAAQGWPSSRYRETGGGWVVRSHKIEYLRPIFAGEQIAVYTWVSDFRKIRSLRKYKMVRESDGGVLALAETDWTFFGLKHRVPRRIPQELIEAFEIVPTEMEP
jgi:acyl-CoA thioester hydrolase